MACGAAAIIYILHFSSFIFHFLRRTAKTPYLIPHTSKGAVGDRPHNPKGDIKLYYYGTETFDVAGRWGGSLIAPNAKVILGQNWNKEIYGQFLAKQIVVHQYAKVWKVAFNPITLDVALKER